MTDAAATNADDASALRFDPRAVTLRGDHVVLQPLQAGHAAELLQAGRSPDVWRFLPCPPPRAVADVAGWIGEALEQASAGGQVPFTIRARDGRAAGSTRYLDIRRADRGLEIGWTWLGPEWQRTAVNTEAKLLLLRHAFGTLGAVRVQLKTDARNLASQRAIERLGAVREGVLRRNMRLWDGHVRDSVYYAILDDEWPAVERRLVRRLERGHATRETPPC